MSDSHSDAGAVRSVDHVASQARNLSLQDGGNDSAQEAEVTTPTTATLKTPTSSSTASTPSTATAAPAPPPPTPAAPATFHPVAATASADRHGKQPAPLPGGGAQLADAASLGGASSAALTARQVNVGADPSQAGEGEILAEGQGAGKRSSVMGAIPEHIIPSDPASTSTSPATSTPTTGAALTPRSVPISPVPSTSALSKTPSGVAMTAQKSGHRNAPGASGLSNARQVDAANDLASQQRPSGASTPSQFVFAKLGARNRGAAGGDHSGSASAGHTDSSGTASPTEAGLEKKKKKDSHNPLHDLRRVSAGVQCIRVE